jgi:hypothetical protein
MSGHENFTYLRVNARGGDLITCKSDELNLTYPGTSQVK